MINLIKDIKENCEDKSIEAIVKFMFDSGDLSYLSNYHREVWFFYRELRKNKHTHREARRVTMDQFQVKKDNFKKIIRKYKRDSIY